MKNLRHEADQTAHGIQAHSSGRYIQENMFLTRTKYLEQTIMSHLNRLVEIFEIYD